MSEINKYLSFYIYKVKKVFYLFINIRSYINKFEFVYLYFMIIKY